MENVPYEIERKFLIGYPSAELLARCTDCSSITQTYLIRSEPGVTERVRKREWSGRTVYTHTRKKRLNEIRRIELEDEIGEAEYGELLARAMPDRSVIYKKRYILDYRDQHFEIDVYPFWSDRAIMELELLSEEQKILFPPDIRIIKEVTTDRRYTNASFAAEIPYDIL